MVHPQWDMKMAIKQHVYALRLPIELVYRRLKGSITEVRHLVNIIDDVRVTAIEEPEERLCADTLPNMALNIRNNLNISLDLRQMQRNANDVYACATLLADSARTHAHYLKTAPDAETCVKCAFDEIACLIAYGQHMAL